MHLSTHESFAGNLLNPGIINVHAAKRFDDIWTGSYNSFAKEYLSGKIFSFGLNNYNQLGECANKIFPRFLSKIRL